MGLSVERRQFLQVLGSATAIGLAGCLSEDDGDSGDDDTPESDGLVYAFAPNTISIIDPEEGEIVEEITERIDDEITGGIDDEGWGDPRITHDHSQLFVIRESPSQILVIDTETREIAEEVDVGPGPTHMYHPTDDEIWAHADDEGQFYVIDTESYDVTTVESGLENEGHGKLLYHEDFGSKAYATNVNDPGVPVIDLEEYERTDFIEFNGEEGTHYKAYSPQNGLAYFEFGDETVVVDTETDEVVDRLEFAGGMYLTPDEQLLGVLDGDLVRFIDVTDDDHEEVDAVEVDGGPDALRYHETDDGLYAITANTMNDRAAVIDVEDGEVIDGLEIGDIVRPDGAPFLHRSGVIGDGYFVTPADDDGIVAVVDVEELEVTHVEVEDGVDTVQYVGDSGVGYTGQ